MAFTEQIIYRGSPGTWTLVSGELPDGIVLDAATGVLSGNPTEYGVFPCRFKLSNRCGEVEKDVMVVSCTTPEILSDEIVFDCDDDLDGMVGNSTDPDPNELLNKQEPPEPEP